MERNLVCAECGGAMQKGYIPDLNHGQMLPSIWVEGKPQKSFWFGLKMEDTAKKYLLSAYRCEKCGFLKFYAK
jgi:hypothetical protein